MILQSFKNEEFFAIARKLEKHHAIFAQLWNVSFPEFTKEIPTAGVYFDKEGNTIAFKINPDFWDTLTDIEKEFVISHECLHVILYHGFRINNLKPEQLQNANIALDLVVNHLLVENYLFDREAVDPHKKYIWKDVVFKDDVQLEENSNYFERFYNLVKDQNNLKGSGYNSLDDHSELVSFNNAAFDSFIKENISAHDLSSFKEKIFPHVKDLKDQMKEVGVDPGSTWRTYSAPYVPKPKWETVIKQWVRKHSFDIEETQWAKKNRRFSNISIPDMFLPFDDEVELEERKKIDVWFFQDTSGSCVHLAERFFKAANTLPKERFNVRMFCFDTKVYETSLASGKLYGFGGTSFSCIEEYIQNQIRKSEVAYPKAVFVITDGYGDSVDLQYPQNWYWFLSTDFKDLIPDACNIFNLSDFE